MVILTAYQLHNVRLLLLSGIGKPYDPVSGEGVVGKNYAYQPHGGAQVMLPKGTTLNPFIGAGAAGMSVDDFNGDNFDHGPLGFIGGGNVAHARTGGRPIGQAAVPKGTPKWGSEWKVAAKESYQRLLSIGGQVSNMPYRDAYLSLDPTYRDSHGQPLLRITFDWHENEIKASQYVSEQAARIGRAMGGEVYKTFFKEGGHYDTRFYQSTHTTGGAIMGSDPRSSVVNRYLQCWDVHNVFVTGASAFPQNIGYNPTATVAALAYWSARAIREQYLKNPGPLVQA